MKEAETREVPEAEQTTDSHSRIVIEFTDGMRLSAHLNAVNAFHLLAAAEWMRWHAYSVLDQSAYESLQGKGIEVARSIPKQ